MRSCTITHVLHMCLDASLDLGNQRKPPKMAFLGPKIVEKKIKKKSVQIIKFRETRDFLCNLCQLNWQKQSSPDVPRSKLT